MSAERLARVEAPAAGLERAEQELRAAMERMSASGWTLAPLYLRRTISCCAVGALAPTFEEAAERLGITVHAAIDIAAGFDDPAGARGEWRCLGARLRAFASELNLRPNPRREAPQC